MVRTRREQPRAAEPRHDLLLGEHVLPRMPWRQASPEPEAAGRTQLRDVVEDTAPDPGDLVEPVLGHGEAVLKVPQVRRVVEPVARPRRAAGRDELRPDAGGPELDRLLVRADGPAGAEPDERRADEAAPRAADRTDEPLDEVVLEEDVVVEEQGVRRPGAVEQRLAVLRHAAGWDVTVTLDCDADAVEHADDALDLRRSRRDRVVLRLVGDDDTERAVRLRHEARERDRERRGPAIRGDQDVDGRPVDRWLAHNAAARMSSTDWTGACVPPTRSRAAATTSSGSIDVRHALWPSGQTLFRQPRHGTSWMTRRCRTAHGACWRFVMA